MQQDCNLSKIQDDSKLLSWFLSVGHGRTDNNLESLCVLLADGKTEQVISWHGMYESYPVGDVILKSLLVSLFCRFTCTSTRRQMQETAFRLQIIRPLGVEFSQPPFTSSNLRDSQSYLM
jgi:hypothetical protein